MSRTTDARNRVLALFKQNGWDYCTVSSLRIRYIVRTSFCLEHFRSIPCEIRLSAGSLKVIASVTLRCINPFHELEILRFANCVNREIEYGSLLYDGSSELFSHILTVPFWILDEMDRKELEQCILFPAEVLDRCAESTVMIEGGSNPRIEAYFSLERKSS